MNKGGKAILTQSVVRVPLTALTRPNGNQGVPKRIPQGQIIPDRPASSHPVGRTERTMPEIEVLRLQRMKDKEEFMKTNAELVAMNVKLLETIASYEKRYADLLADRERVYQSLAILERKCSQLQGERDALKATIPDFIKSCFQPLKVDESQPPTPLSEMAPANPKNLPLFQTAQVGLDENPVKGTKRRFRAKKTTTSKSKDEQPSPSSSSLKVVK